MTVEKLNSVFIDKYPNSILKIVGIGTKGKVIVNTNYGNCSVQFHSLLRSGCPSIKTAINKTEYFIKQLNEKIVNYDFEVLEYIDMYNVITKDKYGTCKSNAEMLLQNHTPTIQTAINKKEYFINKAKEIHGDNYDYSLVEYKKYNTGIKIICKEHGVFEQSVANHLKGRGCKKCGCKKVSIAHKMSQDEFIEKANNIHNSKYCYNLINYINASVKVKIICKKHGVFQQLPSNHLAGRGCRKCSDITNSENNGWTFSKWKNNAEKSKNFDSFKLYIIECWDDEERFYKIGITFTKLNKRFYNTRLPYKWKVLKIYEDLPENIWKKEKELHKLNKEFKYLPMKEFGGRYECFSQLKN